MSLFDWLFKKKNKKEKREELKTEDTRIRLNDEKEVEAYVLSLCEQMVEISKEMEDVRLEYKQVSAHLNDIQIVESLQGEQQKQLLDVATNISKLQNTRNDYLNAGQKISDEVFRQMQENENEIPKIVRRLMDNEKYLDTIKRDLNRLAAEKIEWSVLKQERQEEEAYLKKMSVISLVFFGLAVLTILGLSYLLEWSLVPIFVVALLATISASYMVIRMQDCMRDIRKCDLNQNRAITLENRVKIKYVNIKNAVDYTCNRFNVTNSREMTYNYEQYIELCKEREKLKQTNEDLEYFNNRMIRMMRGLNLFDAKIWPNYAEALVEPKEMVEIKHELFVRRQKLRDQIDYNLQEIKKMKNEAETYSIVLGDKSKRVYELLKLVDELNQGTA